MYLILSFFQYNLKKYNPYIGMCSPAIYTIQRDCENFLFCLDPGVLIESAEPTMVQEKNDGINKDMVLPSIQQKPAVRALPA